MRPTVTSATRPRPPVRGRRGRARVALDALADPATAPDADLLELDDALTRLAGVSAQAADLVKLKFFAGLYLHETAAALGVPPRSADRLWAFARAWLVDALDPS